MNKDDKHCMIDLETLGHNSDAAIIQIGMTIFDIDEIIGKLKINIKWEDALKYGNLTASTLYWWMQQEDKARQSIIKNGIEGDEACMRVNDFLRRNYEIKHFWAHATFDFPILNNFYNNIEHIENPISYRKCRDLRTMDALYPIEWADKKGVYHDALDDAIYQTERLQKQLKLYFA